MDVAVVLCLLQDLNGLFVGDVLVVLAGLGTVLCKLADAHAPVVLHVTGALAADGLGTAAGADAHADLAFIFLQPVGQILDAGALLFGGDGLLHGDDVHADAGSSGGNHLGDAVQRLVGHLMEHIGDFRMLLDEPAAHVQKLGSAGNEQRQDILFFLAGVFPVVLEDADAAHLFHGVHHFALGPAQFLHQVLRERGFALFHGQRQFHHVVIQNVDQSVVFRIGLLYRLDMQPAGHDVRHLGNEFLEIFLIGYHFFLPFCITSKPSLPFSSCFLQNGYLYTYCNLYIDVFQLYLRTFPLPGTHSVVY